MFIRHLDVRASFSIPGCCSYAWTTHTTKTPTHHSEGICQKKAVLRIQDEQRWYLITDVPMHFLLLVCSGVHVQAAAATADYRCGEGGTVNQEQRLTDGFGQIEACFFNNGELGSNCRCWCTENIPETFCSSFLSLHLRIYIFKPI